MKSRHNDSHRWNNPNRNRDRYRNPIDLRLGYEKLELCRFSADHCTKKILWPMIVLDSISIPISIPISILRTLKKNKRVAGRPQDLADAENLE